MTTRERERESDGEGFTDEKTLPFLARKVAMATDSAIVDARVNCVADNACSKPSLGLHEGRCGAHARDTSAPHTNCSRSANSAHGCAPCVQRKRTNTLRRERVIVGGKGNRKGFNPGQVK
jgi:hypothetical protein